MIGSKRALPNLNTGAGEEISVVGNNDANEEKFRGFLEDAGADNDVFEFPVGAEADTRVVGYAHGMPNSSRVIAV